MKLNKNEKIAVILVMVLIISALSCLIINTITPKENKVSLIVVLHQEEANIPRTIKLTAKKYHAYEDLYNTKKPLFVYGYTSAYSTRSGSLQFHEEMQKRFKKEKLNYKYLAVKNWRNISAELIAKYEKDITPSGEVCAPEYELDKKLQNLIDISESCMENACIIDNKKNKMIVISRDIDFIIKVLKEHNPPKQ